MKSNLLILGTKNFNNSLDEIKEDLGFTLTFLNTKKIHETSFLAANALVVDSDVCKDRNILEFINKTTNKPVLLMESRNLSVKCAHHERSFLPINLFEFKIKINNLVTAYNFNKNSSIIINDYILDKNEKKLKKENLFVVITEREVQLIQLLFDEKKSLSKSSILKKIWNYAAAADTHTVETHIYRLRKKILNKFNDENFIKNSKEGYSL